MAQAPKEPVGHGGADFIRQIVGDPKNVPDVMMLTGYLGDSSEEGHERLYLSRDLTNYVEILKSAILHQAPLPKEQDAYGGVTLWVKKDAALQYKMAPAAQALANYFAGAIQAGAQGAAAVGAAQAAVAPVTHLATCFAPCATHVATCAVATCHLTCAPCHTGIATCAPCTHQCTRVGPGCTNACGLTNPVCGGSIGATCPVEICESFYPCPQALAARAGAAAVGAAPQSIGGCGQSVGAGCTAGDCSYLVPCQSQAGTCIPVQTCVPNVCTVDTVCCPTAFVNCPSNHATCAPNCTRAFPCGVSHAICGPSRFEPACQFATNAAACQIVASGPACPQVSLACPQQSGACGGFPGQFGGQVGVGTAQLWQKSHPCGMTEVCGAPAMDYRRLPSVGYCGSVQCSYFCHTEVCRSAALACF